VTIAVSESVAREVVRCRVGGDGGGNARAAKKMYGMVRVLLLLLMGDVWCVMCDLESEVKFLGERVRT
jgi:hypothetical protein